MINPYLRTVIRPSLRLCAICALTFLVVSCGSGGRLIPLSVSGGAGLQGNGVKGPISGGAVRAYEYNGQKGKLLWQTSTSADGTFQISLLENPTYTGVLWVEIIGGTYVNELDGDTDLLTFPLVLCLVVRNGEAQFRVGVSSFITVTPVTTLATNLAQEQGRQNPALSPSSSVATANSLVGSIFGLDDIAFSDPRPGSGSNDTYSVIIAALAQQAEANNLILRDLLSAYALDFADGVRDGADSRGNPITIDSSSVVLTDTFLVDFAQNQIPRAAQRLQVQVPSLIVDTTSIRIDTSANLPVSFPSGCAGLSTGEWVEVGRYAIARAKAELADSAARCALSLSPDNPDANLLLALSSFPAFVESDAPGSSPGNLQTARDLYDAVNITSSQERNISSILCDAVFGFPDTYQSGFPAPQDIQTLIEVGALPRLDESIIALEKIPSDYVTTISGAEANLFVSAVACTPSISADWTPMEADYSDALAARAVLHHLRGVFRLYLAYQLEVGSQQIVDRVSSGAAPTAEDFLASSSLFGTLRQSTMRTAAKNDFSTGVSLLLTLITTIQNESDDQTDDLITLTSVTPAEVTKWQTRLNDVQTSLSGTATVLSTDSDSELINLGKYFEHVPRDFAPSFTGDTITGVSPTVKSNVKGIFPNAADTEIEREYGL